MLQWNQSADASASQGRDTTSVSVHGCSFHITQYMLQTLAHHLGIVVIYVVGSRATMLLAKVDTSLL